MIRRLFGTMLGQILAINAGASALTFLLFLALLLAHEPPLPPPPWPWPDAFRIAALIESIHAVPEANKALIAAAATGRGLSVRLASEAVACTGLRPEAKGMRAVLDAELRSLMVGASVRSCDVAGSGRFGSIQVLAVIDDQLLEIRTENVSPRPPPPSFSPVTLPFIGTLLFLSFAVASMSAWALSRVIGPLRRLAEKADSFGREITVAPIREEGPREIRLATHAFNLMQERIARSIRDRTRMLAAISHDLRTPLTRMRLQLQTGRAEIARGKLIRDVDLMQSMVTSALAFLSGSFEQEEKEWLDLGALLSTLRDEFEEGGVAIRYDGPQQIQAFCRPNAITRAVTNLIENGSHFGDEVTVGAAVQDDGTIVIDVTDNGPGIPSKHLQDVIEPFVRLDPTRSTRAGSVGLGLSIVKEIVQAHSGTLTLINRQPNGLTARLTLPREQAAGRGALDVPPVHPAVSSDQRAR